MSVASPQLEFFRPPATDPNVAWLADYLFAQRDWTTAREILEVIPACLRRNEKGEIKIDDRTIRGWAEATNGLIISGQRGYKHTARATPEEINHCANWLKSQGIKMLKRSQKIRQYAHAKIG